MYTGSISLEKINLLHGEIKVSTSMGFVDPHRCVPNKNYL